MECLHGGGDASEDGCGRRRRCGQALTTGEVDAWRAAAADARKGRCDAQVQCQFPVVMEMEAPRVEDAQSGDAALGWSGVRSTRPVDVVGRGSCAV